MQPVPLSRDEAKALLAACSNTSAGIHPGAPERALDMSRAISKPLWQLLKPDDKEFSLFLPGNGYAFDDFMEAGGYVTKGDESECGWTPFGKEGLVLASSLNVTESTRIVVEGRFRPVGDSAILLFGLIGSHFFSTRHRITETVKVGLSLDGQPGIVYSSVNGVLSVMDGWRWIEPRHGLNVKCVAIGGDIECDWLACAEVEI